MAVKASVTITISKYRDTDSITRYYKLQASTAAAPAVPTTLTPSGWSTSEPTYTSGSTNTLYYTDCIIFSDGTFQYTDDSNGKAVKSSSYEAAKEAYNKAQAAQDSADATQENLDNLEIGGRNLFKKSDTFTSGGTGASGITPSIENGLWKIVVASTNGNYLSWNHSNVIEANINDQEDFVFSFDIKSADANKTKPPTIFFKNGFGYVDCLGSVGSEWTRCYYIGKWKKVNGIAFHFGWNGLAGTYYIRRLKFEKGNKPTDWTPAPEDDIEAINNAQTTADNITNRVNDKENNFNFKYHLDVVVYGESNKFYPVIIKYGNQDVKRTIMVRRGYAEQAPSDWNTSTHKGGLTLKILCNFGRLAEEPIILGKYMNSKSCILKCLVVP